MDVVLTNVLAALGESSMIVLKSDRELAYMRDAGRIVAETHAELKAVAPGITTLN